MSVGEDIICRLCLRVPHDEFVLIDETAKEILEILFVKMNFDVSNNPLMCEECAQIVKRSLSFISMCMDSEEMILSFNTGEDKTNIDLRDVYAHISKESIERDPVICRLCIKKIKEGSFIPLDILLEETMFFDTLKEYISQMDLKKIKNPLVCFHCRDNMESYFKFLRNCCDTEEKVDTYRQNQGLEIGQKIMLSDVFEQFFEYTLEYPNTSLKISKEKKEEPLALPGTENTIMETASLDMNNEALKIESEELIIKDEVTLSEGEGTDPQSNSCKSGTCICNKKCAEKECAKYNSQFEVIRRKPTIYKCKLCTFQGAGIKRHLLIHRDISEDKSLRCHICGHQAKYKYHLKYHLLRHEGVLEADVNKQLNIRPNTGPHWKTGTHGLCLCNKDDYTKECVTCKSQFEIVSKRPTIYKCKLCTFQGASIRSHMLTHRDISGQMYQCHICGFRVEQRRYLKSHLSKHKNSLKGHSLTRQTGAKAETENIEKENTEDTKTVPKSLGMNNKAPNTESEELNFKDKLTSNEREGTDPQSNVCKSGICICNTKRIKKECAKCDSQFEIIRRKPTVFKCKLCRFQGMNIQRHVVIHRDISEVEIFQCHICGLRTKCKYQLKLHSLRHKDILRPDVAEELNIRTKVNTEPQTNVRKDRFCVCKEDGGTTKCVKCRSQFEISSTRPTIYKCKLCTFQGTAIKLHLLTHRDKSEVQTYRCDSCGHQTKNKNSLKKHFLTHKKSISSV